MTSAMHSCTMHHSDCMYW